MKFSLKQFALIFLIMHFNSRKLKLTKNDIYQSTQLKISKIYTKIYETGLEYDLPIPSGWEIKSVENKVDLLHQTYDFTNEDLKPLMLPDSLNDDSILFEESKEVVSLYRNKATYISLIGNKIILKFGKSNIFVTVELTCASINCYDFEFLNSKRTEIKEENIDFFHNRIEPSLNVKYLSSFVESIKFVYNEINKLDLQKRHYTANELKSETKAKKDHTETNTNGNEFFKFWNRVVEKFSIKKYKNEIGVFEIMLENLKKRILNDQGIENNYKQVFMSLTKKNNN